MVIMRSIIATVGASGAAVPIVPGMPITFSIMDWMLLGSVIHPFPDVTASGADLTPEAFGFQ